MDTAWKVVFMGIIFAMKVVVIFGSDARVYWTSTPLTEGTTNVMASKAMLRDQIKLRGSVVTQRLASLKQPHFLTTITCNGYREEVTVVDIGRGNLITFNTVDKKIIRSYGGVNDKVNDIAVDWTTGNIYWTDESHNWIGVTNWNFSLFNSIVTGIFKPNGILVYPQKGHIYWTEGLSGDELNPPAVKRSSLNGKDVETWATTFGTIKAISIDYKMERIFWIDTSDNTVYAVDLNFMKGAKPNPKLFHADVHSVFTNLANVKSLVYITDSIRNQILMVNQTNGWVEGFIGTNEPGGIASCGGDTQPTFSGPCDVNNGGCAEFCFPIYPGNIRKCGCSVGTVLVRDGMGCKGEIMESNFMIIVDSELHSIFQISHDGSKFAKLPMSHAKTPVQVQYDASTHTVFWSDIGLRKVMSASGDGSNLRILSSENINQPTGLAIDTVSRNVYWSDEGIGSINVVRFDGNHRKSIITQGLKSPRGLVLNTFIGKIWWTDWGKQTIETSMMTGKERKIIVNKNVVWPNGLTIDYEEDRIYWCDAYEDRIEMSDYDGGNRMLLAQFDKTHLFGLTTSTDFIYWTDWNEHSVMRMSKHDLFDISRFGPSVFDKLSDASFVSEFPKKYNELLEKHPCYVGNGGCTGLCVPVSKNVEDDMFDLARECMCGDGRNGSCNKPAYTDTTPPSFNGTCHVDMVFIAPSCANFVLVTYSKPVAYDNSGKVHLKGPLNPPPVELREGRYIHSYTAVDDAGNQANCIFLITVKVTTCGLPIIGLSANGMEIRELSCDNLQGSKAFIACDNATQIDENNYMICSANGTWHGNPRCTDHNNSVVNYLHPQLLKPTVKSTTERSQKFDLNDHSPSTLFYVSPWMILMLPMAIGIFTAGIMAATFACFRGKDLSSLKAFENHTKLYKLSPSDGGRIKHSHHRKRTTTRETNRKKRQASPISINVIKPSPPTNDVYAEVYRCDEDNLSVTFNTQTGHRSATLPCRRHLSPNYNSGLQATFTYDTIS